MQRTPVLGNRKPIVHNADIDREAVRAAFEGTRKRGSLYTEPVTKMILDVASYSVIDILQLATNGDILTRQETPGMRAWSLDLKFVVVSVVFKTTAPKTKQ